MGIQGQWGYLGERRTGMVCGAECINWLLDIAVAKDGYTAVIYEAKDAAEGGDDSTAGEENGEDPAAGEAEGDDADSGEDPAAGKRKEST